MRFVAARVAEQRHMRCSAIPTEVDTLVKASICDVTVAHHFRATVRMHALRLMRGVVDEPSFRLGCVRSLPDSFAHLVLVRLGTALHSSG